MDDDIPVIDPVATYNESQANCRRREYANALTGSDRHFAEAARLRAAGDTAGAAAAEQDGLARAQAIKDAFPYIGAE